MSNKPDLTKIRERLSRGENFRMRTEDYKKDTGYPFPIDKDYALKESSIAKAAKEYDFRIEIKDLYIYFIKN